MHDDAPSDAVMGMIEAFEDGDLAPLAAYLRAGGNVFGQIAFMIAMAIDGEGPVKLTIHRTSKDRHAHSELRKRYYRNLKIGICLSIC